MAGGGDAVPPGDAVHLHIITHIQNDGMIVTSAETLAQTSSIQMVRNGRLSVISVTIFIDIFSPCFSALQ